MEQCLKIRQKNPEVGKIQGIKSNLNISLRGFVGCWGARHTFVFLAFLGTANVYAMRVNLSVAIVAMVGGSHTGNVFIFQHKHL